MGERTYGVKPTYEQLQAIASELRSMLDDAQRILVFADGFVVAHTAPYTKVLADLYAEDCDWAQAALSEAGCYERNHFAHAGEGR